MPATDGVGGNRFAADIGLDRDDVVGALDAFVQDRSAGSISPASTGVWVFANNASLGVYAKIVQSADYRHATAKTVTRMVPDLLPIRGERFDLRFTPPDGTRWGGAGLPLVTEKAYGRPPVPTAPETRRTRRRRASSPCGP